ncbi:MAG: stage V sporulation protein AC [Ruminococcaceae bacterium]|nr:stage V sporulation protein AC [Oscillospiraceae bacterium]
MNMDKKQYRKYAESRAPRSPVAKDCVKAFVFGGGICTLAQGLLWLYGDVCGMEQQNSATLVSVTLVALAVLLTGLGVFDNIAKHAGAGTLVPITGFANAVASPALDAKSEGLVLGVGAKIFTVAGPVLLYGVVSGAVWGVIYYVITLLC